MQEQSATGRLATKRSYPASPYLPCIRRTAPEDPLECEIESRFIYSVAEGEEEEEAPFQST